MKSKLINEQGGKTFAVVFETGDKFMELFLKFAEENNLAGSHFTAIGAFSNVTLGYFEIETNAYKEIPVPEQVEVLSLVGDIALHKGKPKIHAHVVVGCADGTTRGGHILEAQVRPTLELILTESPKHLHREVDDETGLPLIRL